MRRPQREPRASDSDRAGLSGTVDGGDGKRLSGAGAFGTRALTAGLLVCTPPTPHPSVAAASNAALRTSGGTSARLSLLGLRGLPDACRPHRLPTRSTGPPLPGGCVQLARRGRIPTRDPSNGHARLAARGRGGIAAAGTGACAGTVTERTAHSFAQCCRRLPRPGRDKRLITHSPAQRKLKNAAVPVIMYHRKWGSLLKTAGESDWTNWLMVFSGERSATSVMRGSLMAPASTRAEA